MTGDNDIIRNPARSTDTVEHEKYVPQYRIFGIEPEQLPHTSVNAEQIKVATDEQMNNDNPRISVDKNIDAFVNLSTEAYSGILPNVGNNSEHLWANDDKKDLKNDSDEYFLLAKKEIIFSGSLSSVEEEVRKIFYEEHELSSKGITTDDLVVLKRVKIKIGVFLEE